MCCTAYSGQLYNVQETFGKPLHPTWTGTARRRVTLGDVIESVELAEIHQLIGSYGRAIDTGNWEACGRLFTADAVIEYQASTGTILLEGVDAIVEWFGGATHPASHYLTNVVVDRSGEADRGITVWSKLLAPFVTTDPQRVFGGDYTDTVVRTADGWRFARKEFAGGWSLTLPRA